MPYATEELPGPTRAARSHRGPVRATGFLGRVLGLKTFLSPLRVSLPGERARAIPPQVLVGP